MSEQAKEVFENQELEQLVADADVTELDQVEAVEDNQDIDDADRELATQALAGTMVKGLEKLVQLRYVHFQLEEEGKAQGAEAFAPIAADFVGDMPDWLKPYAKYLSAGMFVAGVVFEASRQEKIMLSKQEKEGDSGNQSEHGLAESP